MTYRNGNYTAFYVDEPFDQNHKNANTTEDFCYYHLFQAWEAKDDDFHFIDSHNKNYDVRDGSDWEKTLKPRLHERLRNSKNIILILSSCTKNSKALREEIDYGINTCELPIIVIYPDYNEKSDIAKDGKITQKIRNLWDILPIFRDNKKNIPVLHIPYKKEIIKKALDNKNYMINSKREAGDYFYS